MLGFFSFGVGMRESGERFLFLWVSATPPARPTSATPPAIAGPLAFSTTVPTFDLLCAWRGAPLGSLRRPGLGRLARPRARAGLLGRTGRAALGRGFVRPPLRLRCELAFAELLFEPVVFLAPDDELFALDDERDLLPVLVCAIARPPSRSRFPLSSGDLNLITRDLSRQSVSASESPAKPQVRPVGQGPLGPVGPPGNDDRSDRGWHPALERTLAGDCTASRANERVRGLFPVTTGPERNSLPQRKAAPRRTALRLVNGRPVGRLGPHPWSPFLGRRPPKRPCAR